MVLQEFYAFDSSTLSFLSTKQLIIKNVKDLSVKFHPKKESTQADAHLLHFLNITRSSIPSPFGIWVHWNPPITGYKLNTDGSCQNNNITAGGVLRDTKGSVLLAFSSFLGTGTNNLAEVKALLRGLQLVQANYIPCIVESDSLFLIKCIQSEWKPPWLNVYLVRQCSSMLNQFSGIQHTYREGNALADNLALEAHVHKGYHLYDRLGSLPASCVAIAQDDRNGKATFRLLSEFCFISNYGYPLVLVNLLKGISYSFLLC